MWNGIGNRIEDLLGAARGCPRGGDCIATRFIDRRLLPSIEIRDREAVVHWLNQSCNSMHECDLPCPAGPAMAELVVGFFRD